MRQLFMLMSVLSASWFLIGCGGGAYETEDARGTVTCNGKPITWGAVIFSPVSSPDKKAVGGAGLDTPGKGATAKVGEDGTFVLSTYGNEDGAVIGKHTVVVSYPGGGDEDEEDAHAPCGGTVYQPDSDKPMEFEVVSGADNNFTIELTNPYVEEGPYAAQ